MPGDYHRAVKRRPLPAFLADLFVDPVARGALLAGSVALFAAALDPQTWSPGLPSVQAAVRENPELETLLLLASITSAGLILLGGAIGDSRRARPIILGGLLGELVAAAVAMLAGAGPIFEAARLVGHASASFIVPVSIALVATSYRGVVRATAIGIAYGAYGAAGAAAPILLQLIPGEQWPAFVAAIAACLIAIRLASRRTLELQRPTVAERPLVVGVAVWAFGIITLTVGLTWINGGLDNPIRLAMIIGGPVTILGYNLLGSARAGSPGKIVRRRVSVALFVGVVIAISQTAAMLNLPLYFRFVLGYGPTLGVIAVAPLFAALVVAGPVAGFLLERISPRWLVGGGVMVVGAGNLVLWAVASTNTPYLSFVLPCLLIGAGFVIATTVRTAIIFASVPAGLPATAAALNEASISVGSRIGVVIVTALVANVALAAYTSSVANLPAADASAAIAAFRNVLVAVGTPAFNDLAGTIGAADVRPYIAAYLSGLSSAFLFCGLVGLIGGFVALLALGQSDPLRTVWDTSDERAQQTLAGAPG